MDAFTLDHLLRVRRFPPVVHPRHAREVLDSANSEAPAEWTTGYAVTLPEHRQLLEDLLASLAWRPHGMAALVNGRYGTGKSHLLVLLHLLSALPMAWESFADAHPDYRRYALPMRQHRRLVIHFSLDEYGPRQTLEEAVNRELAHALMRAGLPAPAIEAGESRLETWAAVLETCRASGYDGLVLLLDELSLFLAGRSPAKREADAAYLQFLAGWTARAPVWLVGAMQRNLNDVGALRTHSWRQVEDRFRRYTLSPQEIAGVLRDKLLQRTDPAAVRALVATKFVHAATEHDIALSPGALQLCWPFHPAALELFVTIAGEHLSPHRSAVEVLQRLGEPAWLARSAERLITPLELFTLAEDDLRGQPALAPLWEVVRELTDRAGRAPDPINARQLVALLALLHLAGRTATVAQLREYLFDGHMAPNLDLLSRNLHALRRGGAHLAVIRDPDPAAEIFSLILDDEVGVAADLRMQEARREFAAGDTRIIELALGACSDPAWPFAAGEMRVPVSWYGSERLTTLTLLPAPAQEPIVRAFEGLTAGKADACLLLPWPDVAVDRDVWHHATALLTGPYTGVFLLWLPRLVRDFERELWLEYAAWAHAADDPSSATPREKTIRRRCAEHAAELRPAVEASVRACYREGRWLSAAGDEGTPSDAHSLTDVLADLLADGFTALFPAFPALAAGGLPSRAATQQLLAQFIEPGEVHLDPQSLLGEYINNFAVPLGCVAIRDGIARVAPPAWTLLEPLLAQLADGPVRTADAQALLARPPFGLTAEQARLVIFAAARTGAVRPLDGFLQPLDLERTPLARSDALAFIGLPAAIDPRHHARVRELAAAWDIAIDPWPLACSQVEQRLRRWVADWSPRIAEMRALLADWTETLQTMPWTWQRSEQMLAILGTLTGIPQDAPDTLLDALGNLNLADVETLWHGLSWWRAQRDYLRMLFTLTLDSRMGADLQRLREQLVTGERCLQALDEIDAQLACIRAEFRTAYQQWHEQAFGAEVVSALRVVFEEPAFRAVRLLARLPLSQPPAMIQCLDTLATARAVYCPGIFTRLDDDGCCARCRLPLGAPSPMPDPSAVRQWTAEALDGIAVELTASSWAQHARERLSRAPADLADRARAVLTWQPGDGPGVLVQSLDDRLIAWLTRDHPPAARRHVATLEERLRHRDLTLAEAKTAIQDWLDPEQALGEEAVVSFE